MAPDWSLAGGGVGSVDKERARELHEVVGRRQLAALAVHVRLHMGHAVVCLLLGQVLGVARENGTLGGL